ncbi:hypothetical protein MASR2M18_06790 [Ignavibacteria bacterium]|nr:flagellar filament capping protein FliD [Bacteroidota bacterium]
MADLLGTALSVGNGFSQTGQSNTDMLLEAFRRTKQPDIDALNNKKTVLESRQVFLNQLNSKLQTLQGRIDDLQQEGANSKFARYKATSSDTTVLGVTSSDEAVPGAVSVKVERLASADALIGSRKTLADAYAYAGDTKTIDVGGTSVSVTFAADDTNETALKRIATALNSADDTTINAVFIKDTTTTGRLTFAAKSTGASNQITFSDGDALADIGITTAALNPNTATRTLSTGAAAGYRVADYADLSAKATVNGVEVTRDSNEPSDILPGITFSFLKAQDAADQPVSVTVSSDSDGVADSVIAPLLSAFNDVVSFLGSSAQMRGDTTLRSLLSSLRGLFGREVTTTASPDSPKFLADAGITVATNGTLSVTKKDMLKDLLQSNPQKVADLFVSADGFAEKIKNSIAGLTGSDGSIATRTDSLRTQITAVTNRTKEVQKRIDSQAESLRKEYQKMQELYLKAQNQTALLNGFTY